MAVERKNKTVETENVIYEVKVTRAKDIKSGVIAFDMVANGVTINGMIYREYRNKQGELGTMITFPSYKGTNDKYYTHAWFPISKELKADIEKQIGELL